MGLGSQPMAKINNEQRKAFADIIHANGRAHEFYQKYGQSEIVKNQAKAEAILQKMLAVKAKVKVLENEYNEATRILKAKLTKAVDAVEKGSDKFDKELDALGYHTTTEGYSSDSKTVLAENTSRTNAEYEMYKKRALATVWGADTLEEANKAIQNYLNLDK